MEENSDLPQLELTATIGFQGKLRNGLLVHPDKTHIIYGVGQTVMIRDICRNKQYTLYGHTNTVSCLALSKDGTLIASGQANYMGFQADVIVWDFKNRERYAGHTIHKVKVEAVAFSYRSYYLVSLGGQDCRSVVVYDLRKKEPLCGNLAAPLVGGYATVLCCANNSDDYFVTAGRESLRVWKLDLPNRKIWPTNVPLGHIKREIKCLQIDRDDRYLYCGTGSGDILKVLLSLHCDPIRPTLAFCVSRTVNKKIKGDTPCYSMGVTALCLLKTGEILVGTGDGSVFRVSEKMVQTAHRMYQVAANAAPSAKPTKVKTEIRLLEAQKATVRGPVSSIALRGDGHQFFIGTRTCEIYRVSLTEFACELLYTCHGSPVNDVVFPHYCGELFATCARESIRVWNLDSSQELLRITVPNMTCNAITFASDGRSIISGWEDGKIRAHMPESGKPIYIIHDAHQKGVTAVAMTSNCLQIVSGGGEGEVRLWDVNACVQILRATMKEHKGAVTSIRLKANDLECATSGADGSCIIWDLKKFLRIQVVFANTLFRSVCYGPQECQIITCGTDRKIGYWEVFDGQQIRELDGSLSGAVNAMDISDDKTTFVSGGCDKLLKVWKYEEGMVSHIGVGHSDEITAVRISPDKRHIISVSKDGCILCWKFPST